MESNVTSSPLQAMEGKHRAMTTGVRYLRPKSVWKCCLLLFLFTRAAALTAGAPDYVDALTKSLLYFEAQRSGRLPYNQRATWRDHSGLTDGLEQGVSTAFRRNSCT